MAQLVKFILYSFAAWRLAWMLVHERGPGNIFQDIRRHLGVETVNEHGYPDCDDTEPRFGMFCCVFCMSIWTSAAVQLTFNPVEILSVSAGALLVDKLINS